MIDGTQRVLFFHRTTACAEWNATLLLDEANVFLEQRSLHSNVPISVFL